MFLCLELGNEAKDYMNKKRLSSLFIKLSCVFLFVLFIGNLTVNVNESTLIDNY